ncbi:hypothetical protein [Pedobacter metabolipauper]|uniref:Uncharacterized protein n=1 Tax=Pedobacter metabolipauper TaxID=425513 RepID=A0A4R6SNZ3_9SPHI|nr:hypothetical protein [Pedobacter metabolipauper]TDQ06236.1 hypothetical protein ATK78_4617 [Pedobacter metabolipauper]
MLSSFKGNDNGAESSDLNSKIMNSIGPVIAEHWPKIEPYADQALAAAQDDATFETLARKIYPWLPMLVRLAIKEDKFVAFTLQHKGPLLAKLAEVKNKHAT